MKAILRSGETCIVEKVEAGGAIRTTLDGEEALVGAEEVREVSMTEDEFDEVFSPVVNPASGNTLYETYGDDLAEVLRVAREDAGRVWTMLDGDEGMYITKGYHLVNRINHIITEKSMPWAVSDISLWENELLANWNDSDVAPDSTQAYVSNGQGNHFVIRTSLQDCDGSRVLRGEVDSQTEGGPLFFACEWKFPAGFGAEGLALEQTSDDEYLYVRVMNPFASDEHPVAVMQYKMDKEGVVVDLWDGPMDEILEEFGYVSYGDMLETEDEGVIFGIEDDEGLEQERSIRP